MLFLFDNRHSHTGELKVIGYDKAIYFNSFVYIVIVPFGIWSLLWIHNVYFGGESCGSRVKFEAQQQVLFVNGELNPRLRKSSYRREK